MGISFLAQNAGKKSVTLNLKDARGKDILKRLVETADVLVENFRPGVMARLGLDHETLRGVNPRLIYCAISGFGQDGPWADRPAYDQIVQGASGVMSITGDADSAPLRVGYPLADTVGGLTAAMMIASALNATPRGCLIDVSMLDSVIATMGWVVSNHLVGGVDPAPQGNENPTSAPSGTFACADGPINIAANRDEQWRSLARHLGRFDLVDRAEFATREDRKRNRAELRETLEEVLRRKPARDWARELNAIGVPAGAVMGVAEIIAHPQVAGRGLVGRFENVPGVGRDIDLVRIGAMIDDARPSVDTPPPRLGENTEAILRDIGVEAAEIETLRREGVI